MNTYDEEQGTRDEIALRFRVSTGMVKKLIQQRRDTGDFSPRHQYSGRKPIIVSSHREALRKIRTENPEMTLAQIRKKLELPCSLSAIHYALKEMGLTKGRMHPTDVSHCAINA